MDMINMEGNDDEDEEGEDKISFNPDGVMASRGTRLCLFVKERKKAIVFRILNFLAILLDVYSVVKKYLRGHMLWVLLSIIFLITSSLLGSLYSFWCEVLEKKEFKNENGDKQKEPPKNKGFHGIGHSDSTQGFDDTLKSIGDTDSESNGSGTDNASEQVKKKSNSKKTKKKGGVKFQQMDGSPPVSKKPGNRKNQLKKGFGTVVEPGLLNPRNQECDQEMQPSSPSSSKSQFQISLSEYIHGIFKDCSKSMIISHFLLFPKEYRFFRTSSILWKYFKEPILEKEATAMIKKFNVKDVCFKSTWYEYCYKEIISKQISLLMATFQTIPMTIIDLLYWSVNSKEIAKYSNRSIFDINSFGGEQFNIFEIVSLIINICNVSYRLVSLMNQSRKIDFSRQDMKFFHNVFLMLVYFFFLASRVSSIYFVMCLNLSGLLFVISLLAVQFVTILTVSRNLMQGSFNLITMSISCMLMLFLYVPPKSDKKISMMSYNIIISIELIFMFVFGYYQLFGYYQHPKLEVFMVGHQVSNEVFLYGFACSLILFIIGVVLAMPCIQKKLFLYHAKVERKKIRETLKNVNEKFGMEFSIVTGGYGQEKASFSVEKTIYLF